MNCQTILKSGSRKGQACGVVVKKLGELHCGRHGGGAKTPGTAAGNEGVADKESGILAGSVMTMVRSTLTLTFGDQAENHAGMEKIGTAAPNGFSVEELKELGMTLGGEIVDLRALLPEEWRMAAEAAVLLILRGGVGKVSGEVTTADKLWEEQMGLCLDRKALMYGRVVNKQARWNLCFADYEQEPHYAAGKGRIVKYSAVPELQKLRNLLAEKCGPKAADLAIEGNYYYERERCYIGWHGDAERKRVIGVRLGGEFPLYFQWYLEGQTLGQRLKLVLGHGDIYLMSEKAVGWDWKRVRKAPTLRHAAGEEKHL